MRIRLILTGILAVLLTTPLFAEKVNYALGFYAGYAPSLGGNLHSSVQKNDFQSENGLDGMNRSQEGYSTSRINRLMGVAGGAEFKVLFYDYYQLRIAGNYVMAVYGGSGKTVYDDIRTTRELTCSYKFSQWDVPVTMGLSIPFWKDFKIAFGCGVAYANAVYQNKFSSDTVERKGSFKGWGLPLVILLEGEYFFNDQFAVSSILSYYKGSSQVVKDGTTSDGSTDFARIDFTGYRFHLGVSYYFYSI